MSTTGQPLENARTWARPLFWIFCFSFAFDFRGGGTNAVEAAAQLVFLALAVGSSGLLAYLGRRTLTVWPGFGLLAFWGIYLVSVVVVAVLNGVELGRTARIGLPLALVGCGLVSAHSAACLGVPARGLVAAVLAAALVSAIWRVAYGFAFMGLTIEEVRYEILTPALPWLFAYVACAVLLARRFRPGTVLVAAVALGCVALSVTRGLLLPMAAAAVGAGACALLGLGWRYFRPADLLAKLVPAAAVALAAALVAGGLWAFQPALIGRWTERLFHHAGGRTTGDVSLLTREAEAVAMLQILEDEPLTFLYGQGVGASYHWDAGYYPELWLVYPDDHDFAGELWTAGHSIWTYALFSGGVLGLLFQGGFFLAVSGLSLATMRRLALSGAAGGGADGFALAALPFVTVCCILSQSLTSNYFDERLAGLILGVMAGLPQATWNHLYAIARIASIATGSRWDRPAHGDGGAGPAAGVRPASLGGA